MFTLKKFEVVIIELSVSDLHSNMISKNTNDPIVYPQFTPVLKHESFLYALVKTYLLYDFAEAPSCS